MLSDLLSIAAVALITPIPKNNPECALALRPMSVTPILSTLLEHYIVHTYLLLAIRTSAICDQFAFRPAGSTTAALVFINHLVTRLHETNDYIRCLLVDLS